MQAIQTKYIGPTDTKPSRVKAWCEAGSFTASWDSCALDTDSIEDVHARAARCLAEKLGWLGDRYGRLVGGALPAPSRGYVFVFTGRL